MTFALLSFIRLSFGPLKFPTNWFSSRSFDWGQPFVLRQLRGRAKLCLKIEHLIRQMTWLGRFFVAGQKVTTPTTTDGPILDFFNSLVRYLILILFVSEPTSTIRNGQSNNDVYSSGRTLFLAILYRIRTNDIALIKSMLTRLSHTTQHRTLVQRCFYS